ncbi:hypothetical protein Ddye_026665 [Dipteronia dyeriana]|uniref:Reverse transcriptase domain-containing protein n=1 Tax=Dipteronia dyeriana TaxID=168575 RepID=A0AAD9TMN9_9ROSI|nr:hypothetical protein Ddye_026665 [Dipteronia dyeriana]
MNHDLIGINSPPNMGPHVDLKGSIQMGDKKDEGGVNTMDGVSSGGMGVGMDVDLGLFLSGHPSGRIAEPLVSSSDGPSLGISIGPKIEIKVDNMFMEGIQVKLGFAGKLVVDICGRSGGLCLFWACIGNFNEIVDNFENVGGILHPRSQLDSFRSALNDNGLQNLGFLGLTFIWCIKREEVKSRVVLEAKFSAEEIGRGVFDMAPTKEPVPVSLLALFYKMLWSMVGDQVTHICLGILNDGHSMEEINRTIITLIPKVRRAEYIMDFRPISLCNVLYKSIVKSLSNRLKGVLGDIISETQSAFILSRHISDHAIVGFECIHALRCQKKVVVGLLKPSTGLCQGGPLSPYLFLICTEGLSFLIVDTERCGDIADFRCNRMGSKISHLFFVDDSMLFSCTSKKYCRAIKRVLDCYALAYTQVVNFEKSTMCVSSKVYHLVAKTLAKLLGVKFVKCQECYLGLFSFPGKNQKELFNGIRDRVWDKVRGWHNKLFSMGEKEILLKVVVQAIPTCLMSLFRMLKNLVNKLHGFSARFWSFKMDCEGWNARLILECFSPDYANLILTIPTSSSPALDKLIWHFEKLSGYSISSGYHFRYEILDNPGSFSLKPYVSWWKCLWQMSILPKVKLFMWKECNNWLPTRVSLDLHITNVASNDALVHRPMNVASWKPPSSGRYKINMDANIDVNKTKVGLSIITHDCGGAMMIARAIPVMAFYSVQKKGKTGSLALKLDMSKAYDLLAEMMIRLGLSAYWVDRIIRELLEKGSRWRIGRGDTVFIYKDRWLLKLMTFKDLSPPVLGVTVKAYDSLTWNCDRLGSFSVKSDYHIGCSLLSRPAIDSTTRKIGMGIIIRDSFGVVVASSAQSISAGFNSQIAEAVTDIVNLLAKSSRYSVRFMPRMANMAAHCLAKLGLNVLSDGFCLEEVPPCVAPVVMGDFPILMLPSAS